MSTPSGGGYVPTNTQHAIAMITAWLTSDVELMDIALPDAETISRLRSYLPRDNPTVHGVVSDYDAVRDIAIELSLLAATALSCWANSLNIDPEIVLRDVAVRQSELAHETD